MALKFRRGTTAQKSGSLAFGEPYVNTTLGTLQIGGAAGDITLAGASANVGISGSSLDITGNAKIDGNLTLGGNITIGDNSSDSVNVTAALSSSLIPQTTNAFDLGSASKIWRDLYISTGSIKFVEGVSVIKTLSAATLTALEAATGSANASITSLNSKTGSYATTGSNIFTGDQTITGSLAISDSATNFLIEGNGFSQTYLTSNGAIVLNPGYGGVEMVGSYRTIKATDITAEGFVSGEIRANNGVVSGSSQIVGILAALNTFSASQETKDSTLGSLSGSFARTNSANTFNGNQTISGSLTVTQDFIVLGSASIQTISSSRLDIGDNIIQLNVNSPSLRFGGLAIYDSGSAGTSGSFLYDSVEDEFIFVHKGNGSNITSSHFVLGPETYDNLGNEIYMTQNRIPKVTNYEHLGDSNITDNGTLITLGSNAFVNGTFYASGTPLVSGSSQITAGSTTNFATDVKTQLNSNTVISGSSQVSLGSASGNIALATQTTGDYVASLVAGTGVTLSNNSGENATPSIAIGQSVATTATPTFGNLTINGTITATGDITAYYTSDKRHKNNIQTISNAVLKVKQLNGVTWEWNDDVNEVTKSTPKTGLIAQEVQQVLPQVITERADGFLALDYSKMMGLLVEAIKEQQIQIEQLKAQIGSR